MALNIRWTTLRRPVAAGVVAITAAATMAGVPAAAAASAVTYGVVASIPVPIGGPPVAVNSTTRRAYDGQNSSSSQAAIIDTASNTLIGYTPFVSDGSPLSIAVNETANKVVIGAAGGLAIIDGSSNTLLYNLALPDWANAVAVNPATDTIYVGLRNSTVDVVNGRTGAITATIQMSAAPMHLAVDPGSNSVFVSDGGSVSVIDTRLNRVVRTINVPSAYGIAIDQSADVLYAASPSDHTLLVIDAQRGVITASIPVGTFPSYVALDPVARTVWVANDSSKYWPPNGTEDTVTVVDGATNTVTAVVATGGVTQGVAVDSATGTGYVSVGHALTAVGRQDVASPDTATSLQATPREANVSLPLTLKATVVNADGGGDVTFGTGIGASFTAIPECTAIPLQPVGGGSGASCTTTSFPVGNHLVTAEYGGDSASHPSSGSSYINVSLIKTTLAADPVLLRLVPPAAPLFTLQIQLTALGTGFTNAPVNLYFHGSYSPASVPFCRLTTASDGAARCTVTDPVTQLNLILAGGYDAVYEGDAYHAPSFATGALVSVR
jgi:DNA-binding beta-propeller fold protein YncE